MGYEWAKRPFLGPDYNQRPIENLSVSGSTLSLKGVSTITRKTSVGASTALYTLPAPTVAGIEKYISVLSATSSRTCRLTVNSAKILTSGSTNTGTKMTFKKGNASAYLISLTTALWSATLQNGTIS